MNRLSGDAVLRLVVEVAQKVFDSPPPVPAHDARGDLVAEREHQHRRVIAELADLRQDLARISRRSARSSRNAMCCDQGSPTITRSPCRAASSSRSRRGGV